jgi:O-antigen/teichoic acid export membrane protein
MSLSTITLIVIIINCLCSISARWFSTHKQMKPFYILDATAGAIMIIGNTLVFIKDKDNYGPLAYYVLGVWQIGFGIWGLYIKEKR